MIDDKPFGGGPGMVLKIEPICKAIKEIKKKDAKIIFLSPRGKKFTQKTAQKWAKELKQLIIISGRYEGIDERVKKIADETISVGDFITLGGEVPAMAIIEAVARLIKGVVGKKESIEKLDFPQYTRPEVFSPPPSPRLRRASKKGIKWRVPKVLVSGNHKKIQEWRDKKAKEIK
ncbi:MAG: tRNA (guanine37-N1)-methyltransferase [Parcubacteria group bacterium Gr01-1014_2]|nr:MAG: tRNA (guanine37-N1)-methyltransferase [Parcubacteria group bacterium Gr01-1014_2]